MPSRTDYRVLRKPPEIEAFFWRIAPHVDASEYQALIEMAPPLDRIGSYDDLVERAGRDGAVEEIVDEVARGKRLADLPHLILFPSGWLAVLCHLDAGRGDDEAVAPDAKTVRVMICPARPEDAEDMLAALAQLLLGLRDSVGVTSTRVPLPGRRALDWPEPLAPLFDRDRVEAAYRALVAGRKKDEMPRVSRQQRDVIEQHIRWFAGAHKSSAGVEAAQAQAQRKRDRRGERGGDRSGPPALDMKLHIINMRHGELSRDGLFQTSASDVAAIVEAAKDWIAQSKDRRLAVYAHGGLVDEEKAIRYASDTAHWWLENDVYPVFCVWESDAATAIMQLIREALGGTQRGPFDWSELRDAAVEQLVHSFGQPVWDTMKHSAARCSADGPEFGLTLFARLLAKAYAGTKAPPIDLIGHSAGSIVLLPFLDRLRQEKLVAHSFQMLAPAATCRLFAEALETAGTKALKMRIYAMQDATERQDSVGRIYGKSLLYLVSRGFEDRFGEAISGLQKDLLADRRLVALLCRWSDGVTREAMVFSPTPPGTPRRLRSAAQSHGCFDNDPETMWSVMAMLRDAEDVDKISEFPVLDDCQGARGGDGLAFDLPEEVRTYLDLARSGSPVPAGSADASAPATAAPTAASPAALTASTVPAMARQSRKLALTIGIDAYSHVNRLNGCVNDSVVWKGLLEARGFGVTQFIDPNQTGRDQIVRHLGDFVRQSGPGDTLVWHFSGHGMEIIGNLGDDNDPEITNADQAIVAANPDENLEGQLRHAIMDDQLHAILQGLHPQCDSYVFLDCCFSGTGTRFALPGKPRSMGTLTLANHVSRARSLTGPVVAQSRGGPYDGSNHVLFSACSASQKALENGNPPQGAFTRAIQDLLTGPIETLSNQAFIQRVDAMIPNGDQTPGVYCDASRLQRRFPLIGA